MLLTGTFFFTKQQCYVRVEHSARLELTGCDLDVSRVGDRVSASSTLSEHQDYDNTGDTW